jgi:3-methyladenine DNA glycosylase AlkD
MSVVAFTRTVGESGDFTEEMLRLCSNLIWDPEDIVQKGVGWTLKDNLRSAPDRILPYVKDLRRKGVPSTITLYAIRDLKGRKREEVLKIKKI